jgi:hypothetical protein
MTSNARRHKSASTVNLTPLDATFRRFRVTVANKRLKKTISPLYATFTRLQGGR